MSRFCPISKKLPMSGNKVSHANNKSRRKFLPNMQEASFWSDVLQRNIRLKVSTTGIRTIDFKGGFDAFLLNSKNSKLTDLMLKYKKIIISKSPVESQKASV